MLSRLSQGSGFDPQKGAGDMRASRILLCSFCLWSALMINLDGQSTSAIKQEAKQDFSIKVGVEEVRIDTVVLDNKGHQVTDLGVEDFELYQDGKPQKIISCTYVNDYRKTATTVELPKTVQPSKELPKEEIRRRFVFVIDDINLCFDYYNNARKALEKFVETQMQPGDLVAIIQNGQGTGALQRFTSDKEKLFSVMKSLWPPPKPCTSEMGLDFNMGGGGGGTTFKLPNDILIKNKKPEGLLKDQFEAQTAMLNYAIKALQSMPGRKSLVLLSDHVMGVGPDYLYDELADQAMRAGVVIYALDMKGLSIKQSDVNSAKERYLPLPQKTGGMLVENSNFFTHGMGPVDEASRGYYLLSYIPPANTFDKKNNEDIYHRVRVKVKRGGTEVRSRDGFLGSASAATPITQATSLQDAVLSPFLFDDLELSVSSGYAYAPKPGYFLRQWFHLDGKDLTFTNDKDGGHTLALEMLMSTADPRNSVQDSKGLRYDFKLSDADISRIRQEGIDLNTYLQVKNPGKYYVHAAIKDTASGKIGSGYQYLEIQDLKSRRLSLSSLFMLSPTEDIYTLASGNITMDSFSRKWESSKNSPALRSFRKGEGFDYMAIVYPTKNKEGALPKLVSQFTVFREGKEVFKGDPEEIHPQGIDASGRIPILKRLNFNDKTEEGIYQLQFRVEEKQANGKPNSTSQSIEFEILK
jgi:VWFA-related protein